MKKALICLCLILSWLIPVQADAGSIKPTQSCIVSGVDEGNVLNVRAQPKLQGKKVGSIPYNGKSVRKLGGVSCPARSDWFKVRYKDITGWVNSKYLICQFSPDDAKTVISDRTKLVIVSLKQRDMKQFAGYVHPVKGVRFSPYAYVDPESDLKFSAQAIIGIFEDQEKKLWGYYDGSGDKIYLTFADYFKKFVYSHDFSSADQVAYNAAIGSGNTRNNLIEVYPNGTFVEYHFSGLDPKVGGTSWVSLRLVFEEVDGEWYVVGVIHSQWTI